MPIDTTRVAADLLRVLPRKSMSRVLGRLSRVRAPRPVLSRAVELYARAYGVDMSEAEVPNGGFGSFDAFFTRKLRPGARPIDATPDALVSPADGSVAEIGSIEPGARFRVKGSDYDVPELLGEDPSSDIVSRLVGGFVAVVYLHPRNYHRVHTPVDGRVTLARYIPGTLFPVNSIGVRHIPQLFARNERVAVHQTSETFGDVVTLMVGAVGVGHIRLSFEDIRTNSGRAAEARRYGPTGPVLRRGDELGVFHLGSTVIVLTGPEARLRGDKESGTAVRMGEAIARRGLA